MIDRRSGKSIDPAVSTLGQRAKKRPIRTISSFGNSKGLRSAQKVSAKRPSWSGVAAGLNLNGATSVPWKP
ncbi:hypothetical protein J2X35_001903 [Mesorhizobium sp. BE184]|nr:hypothetical protein [Mesorhizobium sp. BE184]MDR7033200.1 hypothetical protein [Mesorhizobium sp. BE184]